jgi:PEP-CTERM motif
MRITNTPVLAAAVAGSVLMSGAQPAHALLGGFEVADGYTQTFPNDVWSYDAGASGATFLPAQYNTGRFTELFGSSNAGGDSQYISRHGFVGGANTAPFALAIRNRTQSPDGSYDMTVQYDVGSDDLGIAPNTALQSASVTFDICPGRTFVGSGSSLDSVFNDVPAFSLSFGGTDASPGATVGFSDHDPSNLNKARFFYDDGAAYTSQAVGWTGRFDQLTIDFNFVAQTFDVSFTPDANLSTTAFDPGSPSVMLVTGAAMTSAVNTLEQMYFRTHTDPGIGVPGFEAGLEKSFVDNFRFTVKPVPEPASLALFSLGAAVLGVRRRQT